MSQSQEDSALQIWVESAPYWAKHRSFIDSFLGPVTPALIEEAGITPGDSVLDVAGGTGEPSLTIAELVGPSGSVLCTDAVKGMVSAAEAEAQRRGMKNMAFAHCNAQALPVKDDSFNAVVSRFGVMFFPEPSVGVSEMIRATRPGGRVSFAVWAARELNPMSAIIGDTIARVVELPKSIADAFRFAKSGVLAQILDDCGVREVRERKLDFRHRATVTFDEFWAIRVEMSDSLRSSLAALTPEQTDLVRAQVRQATARYFSEGQMDIPACALIVTGRK